MNIPKRQPETKKERIAAWRENILDIYHGAYRKIYDKAISGKSLRAAVTAKCQDCMCWQGVEVRNCTVVTCPLHPYRPGIKRSQDTDSAQQRATGAADTGIDDFEGSAIGVLT